jgi:flavin reductase (DIM6/NTAB) family NADH-FMN oxidoreductase RutF
MSTREEKEYTSTGREVTLIDRVFDQMVRGVVVITTRSGEKLYGMSACWVNGSAEQPFLVMTSIWKKNFSRDLIQRSGVYAVNILRRDQVDVARHFGKQSGREVDKFAQIQDSKDRVANSSRLPGLSGLQGHKCYGVR